MTISTNLLRAISIFSGFILFIIPVEKLTYTMIFISFMVIIPCSYVILKREKYAKRNL
jgi:hypothetical protein